MGTSLVCASSLAGAHEATANHPPLIPICLCSTVFERSLLLFASIVDRGTAR
jgi:hypothetical protein